MEIQKIRLLYKCIASLGMACLCACSHLPDTGQITSAALIAARDPFTWVPMAGAVVVLAADENQLADSASRHTPVFGSAKNADDTSDILNIALNVAAATSSVTATDNSPQNIMNDALALTAAAGTTFAVKHAVSRERPDHSDNHSFPSGHTSQAFAAARVLRDNLHEYSLTPVSEQWVDAGIYTAATATGWARIESGEHHPTDVFVGAALGNFMVVWVSEALRQKQVQSVQASVQIDASSGVPVMNIEWRF